MSVYHSTTTDQENSSSESGPINGQSDGESTSKNDLTLDYLASVWASNGNLTSNMLPQPPTPTNIIPNPGEIMRSLITAAAAAVAATAPVTNTTTSAGSMDPVTATTLLCKYSHLVVLFAC